MQIIKEVSLKVLLPGTLLAAVLWIIAVVFLGGDPCPQDYTQAQVDSSGCTIGANIGMGLVFMLAVAVEVVTVLTTIIAATIKWRKNR